MHILLVEDDLPLANGLALALRNMGHAVNHVSRGKLAIEATKSDPPDIVILDLGLPDIDGLEVLHRIKAEQARLPVLVLTARDTTDDIVSGLDSGADDYLPKPFDMLELMARLRVLERRLGSARTSDIRVGPLEINTRDMDVRFNGDPVELSKREYMLLKSLAENPGRVLTRDKLESRLYSWGEEVASNAIEVHIHHLRRKLDADFIQTVRGVGYKLRAPGDYNENPENAAGKPG